MTKDVISLSISVLLLFRHYISHKITFGAPSSGGVLCSACGAFILFEVLRPSLQNVETVSTPNMILNNGTKFHKILIKTIQLRGRTSFQMVNFQKQRAITPEGNV